MSVRRENEVIFRARLVGLYGGMLCLVFVIVSFLSSSFVGLLFFGLLSTISLLHYLNSYFKVSPEGIEIRNLFRKKFTYVWSEMYIYYHKPSKASIFIGAAGTPNLLTIQSTGGSVHRVRAIDFERPYEIENIVSEFQNKYAK